MPTMNKKTDDNNEPIRLTGFVRRRVWASAVASIVVCLFCGFALTGAQCDRFSPTGSFGIYFNSSDPTNDGAAYIGSAACNACHPGYAEDHLLHGHASALSRIEGQPPTYPTDATQAGVPAAPEGFDYNDIAYVIGGHSKGALFVDTDGFLLTTGATGALTQWNLDFLANGTTADFVDFAADQADPLPFDFAQFAAFTTGAQEQNAEAPSFQDNRPGMAGTFVEAGVQCEACHGPGSNHAPIPSARDLFVDPTGASSCNTCHVQPFGSDGAIIPAADGFILPQSQYAEMRASGGHADFRCTFCHDPHVSTTYDRPNAIRNECTACHTDINMALHDGMVFTNGDYVEELSCESCHMPFAGKRFSSADASVVGDLGRMGDTRSHIFRINTDEATFESMFNEAGDEVARDELDRAAVTLDFVCARCHNGIGAFNISLEGLSGVAVRMHGNLASDDEDVAP